MFKSFKELKEEKAKKQEGKVVELPDTQEVLEVSTEPVDTKIEKEDKTSFEEFKVLYKGQIDDKCLEDYGTIEDKKLWEDTAKELFMASEDYIPDEDDKAEKIEESKSESFPSKNFIKNDWEKLQKDPMINAKEHWSDAYYQEVIDFGKSLKEESTSDRYQVREFDGSGAKFGVYDTKEKKFVQKGSKYIMDAACKDLNEKGKVTESSIIKYTLKEMMNKKQESIEDGASIFELKFDCSNEDTFGIGEEMINPIANTLREVIEKIEIGRFDGPIMDVNGNKIGSFGIGYQGVESGLSESKKIEEGIRDELIQLKKDNRGLYDYVANNYYKMSQEELKEIALDAIYVANNDNQIINEYVDRMNESFEDDLNKAKEDSKRKGLYCEGQEDSIYYVYSIYTMKDKNDTWTWKDSFESTGVSDKQEAEEKAKAKVKELKDSGEFYDVSYKEWEEDREEDKKYEIDISRYNTVDKIKARVKEINDELAYCRRRDRVCATFGGDQQVYDLKAEREKLKAKLAKLKKAKKTESSEDLPNITWILENYDWDVDIVTKDQLGSDYYYRTLCTTVNDAERFNYHSDYWGDADIYQQDNIDLMEQVEPYVGKEVIVDFDEGSQKFKILGIVIDKQYNSLSHTCILAEELGEIKTEDHQLYYDDIQGMPTSERHLLWKQYHKEDFEDSEEGNNKFWDWAEEEFPIKELNEAVEEEISVTDANGDINSIMVTYISNQTFMKYYNLEKPITEDEIKNIKLKIKNHEMYITDIADKLGAIEVNSKKELIPNTYVMKIKENDVEDLEESKNIKIESQVSDYTFKELNKVVNDKGNDFKIQIAGSEDKTNWLNIDKEDLQAIYQALQNKKAK